MKVGIVGSRRRNKQEDKQLLLDKVIACGLKFDEDLEIISGGCWCGADKFAEEISKQYGYDMIIRRPKYRKYGRKATFVRNDLIAKESEILIACVAEDRRGGTEDTIKKFKRHHPDNILIII